MQRMPTRTHGVVDYATGAFLLAAPRLLRLRTARSRTALRVAGGGALAYNLLTDYELGVWRKLPMRAHLALDASSGVALLAVARAAGGPRSGLLDRLVPLLVGMGEIAAAALTEPTPRSASDASGDAPPAAWDDASPAASGDTSGAAFGDAPTAGSVALKGDAPLTPTPAPAPKGDAGIPDPPSPQASYPVPDLEAPGGGPSPGRVESESPVHAPPPFEMPGPSVPAPAAGPMSETERREYADSLGEDPDLIAERTDDPMEALVEEEEAAAAAEARMIGGPPVDYDAGGDPAMEPVYQAGGGEAEGFERAEADLIENATHGDGRGNPERDAFAPEAESDRSSVVYGEADEEDVTEVVADPEAPDDRDDPGRGPGLAADR